MADSTYQQAAPWWKQDYRLPTGKPKAMYLGGQPQSQPQSTATFDEGPSAPLPDFQIPSLAGIPMPHPPSPGESSNKEAAPAAAAPSMQALMGGAPDRQSPIVDRGGPGINPNTGRRVPPMSMRVLTGRLY